MNVGNISSENVHQSNVTSKYFSDHCGMEESFADFQEKKKNCVGPKNTQKSTKAKVKKTKKIKGQKDIRTALKPKKNELVAYSKDFDNVCKQSGIDVDPEQLQLAVALSKSLQPEEVSNSSKFQTSKQERSDKIRTTLLEYGFKVPEIKITNPSKRIKKCHKKYKLLLSTDAEKKQLIADKYSQLLFENIVDFNNCSHDLNVGYSNTHLFFLTTNATYDVLRNIDTFYVPNLPLEKLSHKGSCLRDWSQIPGRLASPKICKDIIMDISEITCSQDELDVVLSGTLKCAKNILRSKVGKASTVINDLDENNTYNTINTDNEIIEDNSIETKQANIISKIEIKDVENVITPVLTTVRSCSPDLFDDDASSLFLDANNSTILKSNNDFIEIVECDNIASTDRTLNCVVGNCTTNSQLSQRSDASKRKSNDSMELTECVILQNELTIHKSVINTQLPNVIDVTKRKSDDFMDLTECVIQKQNPVQYGNNLDLTQNINEDCDKIDEIKENVDLNHVNVTKRKSDCVDLTECIIPNVLGHENKIDLTQNIDEDNDKAGEMKENDDLNHVDLTQSSNSNDDLPFVKISGTDNKSLDKTIILNDSEINVTLANKNKITTTAVSSNEEINKASFEINDNLSSTSFFDDFMHNHSDNNVEDNVECNNHLIDDDKINVPSNNHLVEDNNIDLTQSSDSEETSINFDSCQSSHDKVIIENNEISVDYDDICSNDYVHVNENNSITKGSSDISRTDICAFSKSPEHSTHTSQNSEVFEICDKELDYSLHKSRYDDQIEINHGSLTRTNLDLSNVQSCSFAYSDHSLGFNAMKNKIRDSYLPVVDIKKSVEVKNVTNSEIEKSPSPEIPKDGNNASIETPNKEYIVKTHEVTPILDYASMTTPERNKELDKYGLRPFKRKRAIQLLTHIYNQTHPIVVPCSNEELLSASKKRKKSKSVSPTKSLQPPPSTYIDINTAKENIYEITNELPVLGEIGCSSEDWVFQKKEKAKVYSCRVPLHVAFHNLVSCRRQLREAILRYEPVNIDDIHKELVACGYRYDPKDLLKFMDKKCITVKTSDNNARNNKK